MGFRVRRWTAAIGAVSFLLAANTVRAETFVVLDTLTSASFDQSNAYSIFSSFGSSQSVAISFSSPIDLMITKIDTYISAPFGGTIDFGIMSDVDGHPSGQYLSKVTLDPSFDPLSLGPLDWTIGGGLKYWLAAEPSVDGEDVTWVFNKDILTMLGLNSSGDWSSQGGQFAPAVMIEGATPLPGALILFASGLGGVGVFGLRRKRKVTLAFAA